MRWREDEVANFNLTQQIEALKTVCTFTERLTSYRLRNDEISKELKAIEKKVDFIRNGIPKHLKVLAGIGVFLVIEFLFRFLITAIIVSVIIFSLYNYFYSDANAAKREELAMNIFNQKGPSLLSEQEQIIRELETLSETDEGHNASILVPPEFLYPEKIHALINILGSHNAKNISEAIDVYNLNK